MASPWLWLAPCSLGQVRVILPEGAEVLSVKSGVDITVLPEERRYTYLDTPLTGRTVVTVVASNLVDQSNDKLTVWIVWEGECVCVGGGAWGVCLKRLGPSGSGTSGTPVLPLP
jgi:hypothetical protein